MNELYVILAGVLHGSVLEPVLYLLYTADISSTYEVFTATFDDDTVVMTTHDNPIVAQLKLQKSLHNLQIRQKR